MGDYLELAKPWNVRLNQIAAGPFGAEVRYVATPGMLLYEERWRQPMEVRGTSPDGFFVFGTSIASHGAPLRWCSKVVDRRRLACSPSGGAVDFTTPPASNHVALLVRTELLTRALGKEAADGLCGLRHLEIPVAGPRLVDLITQAIRENAARPGRHSGFDARALESRILTALGAGIGGVGRRPEPASTRREAVRRAIEWVGESDQPITALELAAVVGVCPRTLEYGFREVVGTTPGRYLRLHRLNGAYRDLCLADPGSSTVTSVALAWGFNHPGRFSVAYREHFGATPSTTLARSRRRPVLRLVDLIPRPGNPRPPCGNRHRQDA